MVQAFEWKYVFKAMPRLLHFIPITLLIWASIILSGVFVGSLFAVIRTKHIPVLEQLVRVIISVVRGIPPLTQLFIFYFGMPALFLKIGIDLTRIDGMWFVILAYGLSNGAVISENLRAAFASVGKGQEEYAVGGNAVLYEKRDAVHERARLASSCGGEHEERPVARRSRRALFRIE